MPKSDIPPDPTWTPQEQWVWERVCAGEIADFNNAQEQQTWDPAVPAAWSEHRILRPGFLEAILLQDPYRRALTHHGVRIVGARVTAPLDLSDAPLAHPLWLDGSRMESSVDFSFLHTPSSVSLEDSTVTSTVKLAGAKIGGHLNMSGATVTGHLSMNGLQVAGALFMREKAQFTTVGLVGAKIGDHLDMSGATVIGHLSMNGLQVAGALFMREKAQFTTVDLVGAKIDGELSMIGATVTGHLDMNGLQVADILFMGEKVQLTTVDLVGAKIDGELNMSGATVTGHLNMNSLQVGSHLHMPQATEKSSILLIFAEIRGGLDLSRSARLPSLNLRDTRVHGNLWDAEEVWPDKGNLALDGFTYGHWDGAVKRDMQWLCRWLEKQPHYIPQPYEQLAMVLEKAGYRDRAKAILYAGKDRERHETQTWSSWIWLTFQWFIIGYGYYNFRVLLPMFFFCLLGTLVLDFSMQEIVRKMPYHGLSYSLDLLLPIIELHKPHYSIVLDGWVRVYFYIHKLVGYVLAFFFIAGLSGLTKR